MSTAGWQGDRQARAGSTTSSVLCGLAWLSGHRYLSPCRVGWSWEPSQLNEHGGGYLQRTEAPACIPQVQTLLPTCGLRRKTRPSSAGHSEADVPHPLVRTALGTALLASHHQPPWPKSSSQPCSAQPVLGQRDQRLSHSRCAASAKSDRGSERGQRLAQRVSSATPTHCAAGR